MNVVPWFFNGDSPASTDWKSLWKETIARFRELPAFRFASGEISYGEVDRLAGIVYRELSSSTGWSCGTRVSLDSLDPAFPWKAIGTWLAGGVIVPFNKDACEGNPSLKSAVESVSERFLNDDGRISPGIRKLEYSEEWHAIYFTSGSTGEPKGVVRGWDQALYEAGHYAALVDPRPGKTCTMLIDPAFGASTKHFLGCLLSGSVQVLPCDAKKLPREGHLLYGTPSHISSFAIPDEPSPSGYSWISLTGEPCSTVAWQAVQSLGCQGARCLNALGGTEFGVALNMILPLEEHDHPPSSLLGSPLPQKTIGITDGHGAVMPLGQAGLLDITSPWIAKGCLDVHGERPVFEPFRVDTSGRRFFTGDVAVAEWEGVFRLLGRSGSMLKKHGVWMDTTPLRDLLLGSSGGVSDMVAVMNESSDGFTLWIEMPVLNVPSMDYLLFLISENFPDGALIPRDMIGLRKFPRNRHGKVDLRGLSLMSRTPDNPDLIMRSPGSRIDRIASVLSAGDFASSLFDGDLSLGDLELDSLELHELAVALERSLGREVPMESLLTRKPLRELASRLKWNDHTGFSRLGNPSKGGHILWFGPGTGSLVQFLGGEYEIWHWNCDWITARQGDIGRGSLVGLADRLLSMTPPMDSSRQLIVGGFSFGAMIAHEASRILSDSGRVLVSTILLDPPDLGGRHIRSVWRWSRWRPFLLRFLLRTFCCALPGDFGERFRAMEIAQTEGCVRETHRDMMRHYQPSRQEGPTILITSREFHLSSNAVFEKCAPDLKVVPLPVGCHRDVLQSPESIREWIGVIAREHSCDLQS
jgi:acyl-CoA synthetase (AMP-forming)/AMP-acid ligase II/acyl carrier protein